MAPKKQYPALQMYSQNLSRCRDPFPCRQCGVLLKPKDYENHCAQRHAFDPKRGCVWCWGQQTWEKGQKGAFAHHLLDCWNQWKVTLLPESPALNLTPPHRDAFGRSLEGLHLDPIFPMPADPCTKSFGDPYLDLAASYLERYRRTQDTCDWLHVMVRALALPTFLQALREDGGQSTTLPFWCWCDGGPYPEARHRNHRHMIVVSSPPDHFQKNVWGKVRLSERPFRSFPCKKIKAIVSEKHLINTLGYLSHTKSRCRFGDRRKGVEEKNQHFYLYYPRPTVYHHAMALLYPGGCMELITELYGRLDPAKLAEVPSLRRRPEDQRWCLPVKAIPGLSLDVTVTVVAHLPDQFLYVGARPVRLPVGRKTTIRLFEAMGEETWCPRPQQQQALHTHRAALRTLQTDLETLKGEMAEQKRVNAQLEQENETQKRVHAQLKKENETQKRVNAQLEKENETLRGVIAQQSAEIATLKRKRDPFYNDPPL